MSEARSVTVGVDGSAPAMAALDWAAQYAHARNMVLQVLTAVGWPGERPAYGGYQLAELKDAARIDGQHTVDAAVDRVRTVMPGLAVAGRVSDEPAVRALLDASVFSDLVVVGCRGLTPTASVVLGSVSTALSAHAASPVVVVRSDRQAGPTTPVVAGIDGSERDEATLEAAFAEADRAGAPLVVAHAWSDVTLVGVFGASVVPSWIEARHDAEELVHRQLAGWHGKYPDVRIGTVVEREQPAHMLLELAATAGLVVVGSHGRGGFAGMRLGSVARRLLHYADAPVLIVRGPHAEH
ncbi:universal stress protein [Cryptosporangium aurantiacum]|uniref:Nucleotide-binding universal stress protein, UspA family n=1 Tax=Cryptosporangium aurantiacum TaxID=134849 RepID=A0A1M7TZ92_9ACTN|nr:universal stress protein [Cryptosporangium aurantiacum]SHN75983.1 Nucleotide-binding universal stress protein, UspA family [Cryptosporangium aurantiacum]